MAYLIHLYISFMLVVSFCAEESTLELVHVFFRHGSRTPEKKDCYPRDPITEKDFNGTEWGHLTNEGKQRAYKLGQLLRNRYNDFLGDRYQPDMVHAQSTDTERTKMSALLVLAGLFPPKENQVWNNNLTWQPIPFYFEKAKNDYFLRRSSFYCPAYNNELLRVFANETKLLKILEENANVFKYIENNSGRVIRELLDVFWIYQVLYAEDTLQLKLPEWTRSVYPQIIHQLAGWQCAFENWTPIMRKLNGGRSLSKVLQNIQDKIKKPDHPTKIYLYSGHENNVVNVLTALKMFEPHVPNYSSAVIIELHGKVKPDSQMKHEVKILYIQDVNHPHGIDEKSLQTPALVSDLEKFMEDYEDIIPRNYTHDCQSEIPLD